MLSDNRALNKLLNGLADSLDIPESRYEEAKDRYTSVGKWLSKEGSPLAPYNPEIYPQGSFNLGTVIKPITDSDEYDIDLVCELAISKQALTQEQLKQAVGNRLKGNKDYNRMLDKEEGRRCWTLHYADGAQFHMDILPAVPDEDFRRKLRESHVPEEWANTGICITDRRHADYRRISAEWPCSNPKGYTEWFRYCMRVRYDEQRLILMEKRHLVSIDDVPYYAVKTPLQRSVQILKRHRDIMFAHDHDDKPISIIITTLAGRLYNNEADLSEALDHIVNGMITILKSCQGEILNPVNPKENFADKWREHPQREIKFNRWIYQVRQDIDEALRKSDVRELTESLMPKFGERMMRQAASNAGIVLAVESPHVQIKNPSKPWKDNE
jgi:hypothetical protein